MGTACASGHGSCFWPAVGGSRPARATASAAGRKRSTKKRFYYAYPTTDEPCTIMNVRRRDMRGTGPVGSQPDPSRDSTPRGRRPLPRPSLRPRPPPVLLTVAHAFSPAPAGSGGDEAPGRGRGPGRGVRPLWRMMIGPGAGLAIATITAINPPPARDDTRAGANGGCRLRFNEHYALDFKVQTDGCCNVPSNLHANLYY